MGKFFNDKVMNQSRIPRGLERQRQEFNHPVELTTQEKREAALVKARAARKHG